MSKSGSSIQVVESTRLEAAENESSVRYTSYSSRRSGEQHATTAVDIEVFLSLHMLKLPGESGTVRTCVPLNRRWRVAANTKRERAMEGTAGCGIRERGDAKIRSTGL